jgi:hypothetical protein
MLNYLKNYFIRKSSIDDLLTQNSELSEAVSFLLQAIQQKADPNLILSDWDNLRNYSSTGIFKHSTCTKGN